jgi:predicted LPLAT superfamily acyltransferase
LGCPVFLLFCLKQGKRFRVIYEPFAELIRLPRAGREAALKDAVQRYALRLQERCLSAPYQWFNFYAFWS